MSVRSWPWLAVGLWACHVARPAPDLGAAGAAPANAGGDTARFDAGSFDTAPTLFGPGVAAADAAAAPELAATPPLTGQFSDFSGQIPGGLVLAGPAPAKSAIPNWPGRSLGLLADVDGDGVLDLTHTNPGGSLRIVRGPLHQKAQTWTLPSGIESRIDSLAFLRRPDGKTLLLFAAEKGLRALAWENAAWVEKSKDLGLPETLPGTRRFGVHVADFDNDGLLDFAVALYGCPNKFPHLVWLDRGDGVFAPAPELGLVGEGSQWGVASADWDLDGDLDVAWLGDGCGDQTTTQSFYRNDGRRPDGWPQFTRTAPTPLFAFPTAATPLAAPMGLATGDFNNDGQLDAFVTLTGLWMSVETAMKMLFTDDPHVAESMQNQFLLGQPDHTFVDDGAAAGVKQLHDTGLGVDMITWTALATDIDRDGWLDLALTTAPDSDGYLQQNRGPPHLVLLRNDGKATAVPGRPDRVTMTEISSQLALPVERSTMSLSTGDIDGDGDDDWLVGQLDSAEALLLRNETSNSGHWLRLKLVGRVSNVLGLGARVTANIGQRTLQRVVGGDAPFATAAEPVVDFGLGPSRVADVTVYWPSGYVQHVGMLGAEQTLTVEEPRFIELSARSLLPGQTLQVTVRPIDAEGKAVVGALANVQWLPADAPLHWQTPLTCAGGTCTGQLATAPGTPQQSVFLQAEWTAAGAAPWTAATAPRLAVGKP